VRNENTRGASGWCLESHDLVLAKLVAGREKDRAFATEALRHDLVRADELRARVPDLPLPPEAREGVEQLVDASVAMAAR